MPKRRKARTQPGATNTLGAPDAAAPARRRRRKRGRSRVAPALVLLTAAGSATVAAYVLFFRPTPTQDDAALPEITAPDVGAIGAGQAGLLTLVSRETGRREAVIEYQQWDPVGQGRYDATQPRAWVYLKSGGYVFLRADTGRFHAPAEQRPQSGVLRGNVVVKVFDPAPTLPDENDPCAVTFTMPSVSFDTEYGAVWAPATGAGVETPEDARIVITTDDGIEFVAHDIRVVVNQVQERIELLECRRGERLTFTPARAEGEIVDPGATPPSQGSTPTGLRGGVPDGPALGDATQVAQRAPHAGGDVLILPMSSPQRSGAALQARAPQRLQTPAAQPTDSEASDEAPAPAGGRRRDPGERPVLYLARFEDNVRLSQGGLVARGDTLDVWARTIGGRLPEGAIGGAAPRPAVGPARSTAPAVTLADQFRSLLTSVAIGTTEAWPPLRRLPDQASGHDASSGAAPAEGQPEPPAPAPPAPAVLGEGIDRNAPMTLEWDGPLNLRPLAVQPPELEQEHVAARLVGGQSGGVTIADASSGASGVCTTLDYAFTSQRLVVAGLGDTGARLALPAATPGAADDPDPEAPDQGALRAARIEYAAATGIGRVPGAGVLDSGPLRSIAWSEQMDFVLRSADGRVLSAPEEVFFRGDVRAEDDAASFRGGFAHAQFQPGVHAQSFLSSLTLEDGVDLRGRQEERLTAPSVRVEFAEDDSGQGTPTWFLAEGGVIGTRPGDRVQADSLEATLAPDDQGRPQIRRFEAQGAVDLRSRAQALEITGTDLGADLEAQRLRVRGDDQALAAVTRADTTIRGVDVRLDAQPAMARVYGRGAFEHRVRDAAPSNPLSPQPATSDDTRFDARWTRSMSFTDADGSLEAVGDVDATVTQGRWALDRLSAWTVRATLDPATNSDQPSGVPASATLASADMESPLAGDTPPAPDFSSAPRALRTLSAIGSLVDSPDGEPATIELRRFAPAAATPAAPDGATAPTPAPVPTLVQLLYLEGARIDLDNLAGRVDVPGPGRLMVVDRRTPDADRPTSTTASTASPFPSDAARGDALFDWQGSMVVERPIGQITMRDRVRMVHRRASDDVTTILEAPVLIARAAGGAINPDDNQPGRLTAVHAEGGVWVRSADREVTADVVDYDADTGILTASALPGGSVRVMEGATVWNASAIRWDMTAGRIEISNIGGGATPR